MKQMKHLLTVSFIAVAIAAFSPSAAQAGCGSCGNDKAHSHEAGHKHEDEAAKCDACGKAPADCICKKDGANCDACDKAKDDCTCDKD
jgi:hypothetical protein